MRACRFTPWNLLAARFVVELGSQRTDEPRDERRQLLHVRRHPRQQSAGDCCAGATHGACQLIGRRLGIGAQPLRSRLAFGSLDPGIVANDARGIVHPLFSAATTRLDRRGRFLRQGVPVPLFAGRGPCGIALHLIADAQHQLRGRLVHLELDRFEMAATAGTFVDHRASNRQEWEGLFDRELGVALRLNLGHDGRAHAIEQQTNGGRRSRGAAPTLN